MSRITRRCVEKPYATRLYGAIGKPCNDIDYLEKVYNKLGKLEDLEEQLGCPLDVFLGLATHKITEIYIEYDDFSGIYASPYCFDEDVVVAYVAGIYDNNEIDGLCNPEWKIETNMGTFPLSDYKKHLWLRKDKSE